MPCVISDSANNPVSDNQRLTNVQSERKRLFLKCKTGFVYIHTSIINTYTQIWISTNKHKSSINGEGREQFP